MISQIKKKRCTPFIGAGAGFPWLPLGSKIAIDWAQQYDYPLQDRDQLDKVAQFVGIVRDNDMIPKIKICDLIGDIPLSEFIKSKDTPHAILSKIKYFPIYITTNYDKFMEESLKSEDRIPDSEYLRWNEAIEFPEEKFLFEDSQYKPTRERPLVYHLHGLIDVPQSIVLTERDYIYFLINLSRDETLLPTAIRRAIASTTLLFIGYSLEDINFRVIFQGIMNIVKQNQFPSIAVQLPPSHDKEKNKKIMDYMNKYTQNMFKVSIHWGDAKEFVTELQKRLEKT